MTYGSPAGVELLQPSTAIAGVLLALLLGNTVRVALMPASQRQPPRQELALQAQITQAVSRRGAQMASVLGAIAVVMHRRLSGELQSTYCIIMRALFYDSPFYDIFQHLLLRSQC